MVMATQIDSAVAKLKGLRVNSAGYCGALQRDLGFAPDAAAAFCLIYFVVPLLTHAASGKLALPARSRAQACRKSTPTSFYNPTRFGQLPPSTWDASWPISNASWQRCWSSGESVLGKVPFE